MACLEMQAKKLLPLPLLPWRFCTTVLLLLLIMCSLLSSSHAECSDSNLQLTDSSYTWRTFTYDTVDKGYLYSTDSGTLLMDTLTAIPQNSTLGSYRNNTFSKFPGLYFPSALIYYGGKFKLSFTMSVYEPNSTSSLVLALLPVYYFGGDLNRSMAIEPGSWSQKSSAGSQTMGSCKWPVYDVTTACVQISIEQGTNSVESSIVYDPLGRRLSVSVGDAAREPEAPYAIATSMAFDVSGIFKASSDKLAQVGLFSSIGQLAQLQYWNLTVDLPAVPKKEGSPWVIMLSSVLGSVAAAVTMAAAVYCYLNSKYRRWKKDLDQLTKTMQNLPGMPTQVDFAVIKKATNNFHETMKLGRGGFGAVYGCTLPAAASRTGKAMKVAVKKFTRELTDRRYEDFLSEVSIINRLRHKNVVPLVGWSYNKGEPLLIYEYMKNGSLDQHLFQSGGLYRGNKQQDTAIVQWDTRYGIARDIATGLHYLHHEHEPIVLHRDIKASNIMLDSTFCARVGDFGISCTVDAERSSVTGIAGTIGYIGPEYVINCKATRQTDIYAFGVVILEIVTGKKNMHVPADDGHITQWVRRLHREGTLLEALGDMLVHTDNRTVVMEEAERLLLIGLACTNPNPSSRPSMTEVLQVINKLAPPPDVSSEPTTQVWMFEGWSSSVSSEYGPAVANQEGSQKATSNMYR